MRCDMAYGKYASVVIHVCGVVVDGVFTACRCDTPEQTNQCDVVVEIELWRHQLIMRAMFSNGGYLGCHSFKYVKPIIGKCGYNNNRGSRLWSGETWRF